MRRPLAMKYFYKGFLCLSVLCVYVHSRMGGGCICLCGIANVSFVSASDCVCIQKMCVPQFARVPPVPPSVLLDTTATMLRGSLL